MRKSMGLVLALSLLVNADCTRKIPVAGVVPTKSLELSVEERAKGEDRGMGLLELIKEDPELKTAQKIRLTEREYQSTDYFVRSQTKEAYQLMPMEDAPGYFKLYKNGQ